MTRIFTTIASLGLLWLVFGFLYLPLVVVAVMSFNSSDSLLRWGGFTFDWYRVMFENEAIRNGLLLTLSVAVGATLLAGVLGTLLAFGIHKYTKGSLVRALATAPALLPDLLLGTGLLTLFGLLRWSMGIHSVLIGHAVFAIAFVTTLVLTRLASLDPSLEEASASLGAGGFRTFRKVTLPQALPGVLAGCALAFSLSIDEFVIAYFTASPTSQTLPIYIYSTVRFGVSPDINAMATVLLAVAVFTVIIAQRFVLGGRSRKATTNA